MGFYYTTYLHYDTFDENNIKTYVVLATLDPILEFEEKTKGIVLKDDIERFI
jgi:hypothetical protein